MHSGRIHSLTHEGGEYQFCLLVHFQWKALINLNKIELYRHKELQFLFVVIFCLAKSDFQFNFDIHGQKNYDAHVFRNTFVLVRNFSIECFIIMIFFIVFVFFSRITLFIILFLFRTYTLFCLFELYRSFRTFSLHFHYIHNDFDFIHISSFC